MTVAFESARAWFLAGAFTGAQLLLALLSVLIANAYGDRGLLLHAGAIALGVAATLVFGAGGTEALLAAALLLMLALATLHLSELTSHVGSLRQLAPWPRRVALGMFALAALALAVPRLPWIALGAASWLVFVVIFVARAWPQSKPWVLWLIAGDAVLLAVAGCAAVEGFWRPREAWLAGALAFWSMAVYLSNVWRSRLFGENRWRQAAEQLLDPLTGLSTPKVLTQRIQVGRGLMRRYGHPGSLLLVHADPLERIASEMGARTAEAAALEAGLRIRSALSQGEVASRIAMHRFAIFSEGSAPDEASGNIASRVLVAGLREELRSVPGVFLRFRVVLAPLPINDEPVTQMLNFMSTCMDADVEAGRHRRIRVLSAQDLAERSARQSGNPSPPSATT
ncbi:MAG: GGDEF domain-containing protein [Ramlibacter sp.]